MTNQTEEESTKARVVKILVRVLFALGIVVLVGLLLLCYFISAWGSKDPALGLTMFTVVVVWVGVLALLWRWCKWGK